MVSYACLFRQTGNSHEKFNHLRLMCYIAHAHSNFLLLKIK